MTVKGSISCSTATASYVLDVVLPCTSLTITPSTLTDQEYTITDTVFSYQFDAFTVDPPECSLDYSFSVTDAAGTAAIQNFDSVTRTFSFYYDADILLSGGPAVEFVDYTITVQGSHVNSLDTGNSVFNLKLRNPCFDPAFV